MDDTHEKTALERYQSVVSTPSIIAPDWPALARDLAEDLARMPKKGERVCVVLHEVGRDLSDLYPNYYGDFVSIEPAPLAPDTVKHA